MNWNNSMKNTGCIAAGVLIWGDNMQQVYIMI